MNEKGVEGRFEAVMDELDDYEYTDHAEALVRVALPIIELEAAMAAVKSHA